TRISCCSRPTGRRPSPRGPSGKSSARSASADSFMCKGRRSDTRGRDRPPRSRSSPPGCGQPSREIAAVGRTRMSRRWAMVLAATGVVSIVLGLSLGAVSLPLGAVWNGLWHADTDAGAIVRNLRAPRLVLAFLVGGSLAVSGAALQAMLRNPLAEPFLLGL